MAGLGGSSLSVLYLKDIHLCPAASALNFIVWNSVTIFSQVL